MTTCTNVTYHEAVNIAIASEAKYRQHKELKKKSMPSGSYGGNPKRQRVIYHPVNHNHPLIVCRSFKPVSNQMSALLQLIRVYNRQMLLGFLLQRPRVTSIPVSIVVNLVISRENVRI